MAKKKTDKETEPKKISKNRFTTFFKSETTHFVIGLISVIFSVYLLLAFISFFFTGAADQSILDNQQPGELMQTTNHVKNYAGARGAQLAEFLINECFGIAACFIILFLAVAGMKMIKAYQFRVWKWFMSCSILLVWFSITLGFIFDGTFSDSFIYPGGLHGYNVSAWLVSQIGMPGLGLLLLITAQSQAPAQIICYFQTMFPKIMVNFLLSKGKHTHGNTPDLEMSASNKFFL